MREKFRKSVLVQAPVFDVHKSGRVKIQMVRVDTQIVHTLLHELQSAVDRLDKLR